MSSECSSGVAFAEGNRIKGYRIEKAFAPGSMSFVGKAVAPNGRTVFFKKYRTPGSATPWLDGFIRYQQDLKALIEAHPAAKSLCYEFIEFFDLRKDGEIMPLRAFYQVFEWVDGGMDMRKVLDELRSNPRAYDWKQRVIFARVMVAGVNAIHQAGVIHTDLKPENLYLMPDPAIAAKYKLRVIDFDASLIEGRQAPWHGHKGYFGTPGYMSPEHLGGPDSVPNKASDVFTCALILGELIGNGHPCGSAMDEYDERVKTGALGRVAIADQVEGCPDLDFLNHVINSCLSTDHRARPTAGELLLALNGRLPEFRGRRPVGDPLPPSRPTPERPPPPPNPVSTGLLELMGPAGQRLPVNIETRIGKAVLKPWGEDYGKFLSEAQFRFFKNGTSWMVEHCQGATNQSNADGQPLTAPLPVRSGMVLTVGRTKKCPVQVRI